MPQPVDYVVDPLLTRIAKSYANKQFISDMIFPRVEVDNERGYYYVYDKTGFRIEKDLRTGIARANRVDYGMSLASYGPLLEHSLEQGITDREKQIMGEDVARSRAATNVTAKIELNHEKMVADMLRNTSIVTQNVTLSGTSQLSDYTNSDPLGVFQTAFDTIEGTGIATPMRKVLIFGYQAWAKVRMHTKLLGAKSTASLRTPMTLSEAAALFEVDEVIVGAAMYDTAVEGQTPSLDYIWGKDIIAAKLATTPSLDQVNPGYTLTLKGARYVDRWDERQVKTEFVRGNDFFEPKLVATEAVYLVKNAVA